MKIAFDLMLATVMSAAFFIVLCSDDFVPNELMLLGIFMTSLLSWPFVSFCRWGVEGEPEALPSGQPFVHKSPTDEWQAILAEASAALRQAPISE